MNREDVMALVEEKGHRRIRLKDMFKQNEVYAVVSFLPMEWIHVTKLPPAAREVFERKGYDCEIPVKKLDWKKTTHPDLLAMKRVIELSGQPFIPVVIPHIKEGTQYHFMMDFGSGWMMHDKEFEKPWDLINAVVYGIQEKRGQWTEAVKHIQKKNFTNV